MLETIVRGVAFFHTHNIIVGDLKFENILLPAAIGEKLQTRKDKNEWVSIELTLEDLRGLRLADFDALRTVTRAKCKENWSEMIGTADCRAPENAEGGWVAYLL